MSKKKNTLLRNTSILMAATIISRVIGLLYRSPLGETIGNEGLGYYSTASNLYTILLLISSYSIPMAVSKIVSERLALKEYRNAHRVFHGALIYAVIVGGIAALVAFFGGKFLLPYNQQNALLALRVLAPTIFFSAVLGVLRGYFQAHSTMMPTSISQIIEQVFNAAFSIGAAWFFIQQFATNDTEHAKFGAAGGTLGTGAGVWPTLLAVFTIHLLGIDYTPVQYAFLVVLAVVVSIGTVGVPGTATITATALFAAAGLPVEAIILLSPISSIADMARTATNVVGAAAATTLVAATEGQLDKSVYNGEVEAPAAEAV